MEEKNILDFQNEVEVNLLLDHPNITKVHEWFEDEKRYMLISELCIGGELFELIQNERKFEHREVGIILKQIVSAIIYMHKADSETGKDCIVHRDLKPENILLTDMEGKFPTVKLIDFGTAKRFKKDDNFVMDISKDDFVRRLKGKFTDAKGEVKNDIADDYNMEFKIPAGYKDEEDFDEKSL